MIHSNGSMKHTSHSLAEMGEYRLGFSRASSGSGDSVAFSTESTQTHEDDESSGIGDGTVWCRIDA